MHERLQGSDVLLPPLPIGALRDRTLRDISLAGQVHFRSGPWVPMAEDDSRVVRVTGTDDLLFGRFGSTDDEVGRRRTGRRAIRQVVRQGRAPRRRRGRTGRIRAA